jgi:hypothetical protein
METVTLGKETYQEMVAWLITFIHPWKPGKVILRSRRQRLKTSSGKRMIGLPGSRSC